MNVTSTDCLTQNRDTVCDSNNQQYPSPCFIKNLTTQVAYRGVCVTGCSITGQVCGFNGKTYRSECAAWADYVSVDYNGPCRAIGLISDKIGKQCSEVECKPLPDIHCLGYTPPGACCPICGGALKLIYSRKQIDRALYALRGHSMTSLTLQSILQALERQIQIAECAIRGFLSIELDIFVMVQTIEKKPSSLQLEACVREAEKLASLIRRHSPRVQSELSLSALTAATIVHAPALNQGNGVQSFYYERCYLVVFFGLLTYLNN